MRKLLLLIFLAIGFLKIQAQKRKHYNWQEDVKFSVDPHVKFMTALGNNFLKDVFGYFYGFGIGGNVKIYKNFGMGIEYTYFLANDVKNLEKFGNLGAPSMNNFDGYIFHEDKITDDFFIEELVGYSTYRMKSPFLDNSGDFREGNGGLNFGAKAIYTIDNEGFQQVVFGTRLNFYNAKIGNQNPDIEKYYSKAILLNLSLAYRFTF
ncbi:hypothetical protein [Epilithonimonas mollis]|uniref:Outer membrane protein beta-barrel domain-containing protein n=1 Tax=Epilithonimonas mollis TaxID=216903 RepID=A0A1M6R671_9FLAO|nr:hypothetical protein [Epilithonimonas mollis]SHK27900.1 hypothetical protein SAMN05444371_1703 [Epilithonimonas mollis]